MARKIQVAGIVRSNVGGAALADPNNSIDGSTNISPKLNSQDVDESVVNQIYDSSADLVYQLRSTTTASAEAFASYTNPNTDVTSTFTWETVTPTSLYNTASGTTYQSIDDEGTALSVIETTFLILQDPGALPFNFPFIENTGRYYVAQSHFNKSNEGGSDSIIGHVTLSGSTYIEVRNPDNLYFYVYDDAIYPSGPLGPAGPTGPEDDPDNPNDDPTDPDDGGEPFDPNFPIPNTPDEAGDGDFSGVEAGPPDYKILLRSRDVTSVINGFGWLMEKSLPYYLSRDELTYTQLDINLDNSRIQNLSAATADSDLIRKSQAEGLV